MGLREIRQGNILLWLSAAGTEGMTTQEVALASDEPRGTTSSAMSEMHAKNLIAGLEDVFRGVGGRVYVAPEHVGDRPVKVFKPRAKRSVVLPAPPVLPVLVPVQESYEVLQREILALRAENDAWRALVVAQTSQP